MITAISWVPRGAAKRVPVEADPPTLEEIEEAMRTIALGRHGDDADADEADGDSDGGMEVEEVDEFAQAKAIAKALGKSSSGAVGGIDDELAELNMDDYDDEEGFEIFSSGVLGDLYYATNDDDPYLIKNKHKDSNDDDDDDEDDEEIEDMIVRISV